MQLKTFLLPAWGGGAMEDEINRFLRSKNVLNIEKHFCPDSGGYWTFCIEYMDYEPSSSSRQAAKPQKDATEDLSDVQKERFERYREIRKDLAKQFNIPPYLVFNNEELAAIAKLDHVGPEISKIEGVAPQRYKDFIKYFYTGDETQDNDAIQDTPKTEKPDGDSVPF